MDFSFNRIFHRMKEISTLNKCFISRMKGFAALTMMFSLMACSVCFAAGTTTNGPAKGTNRSGAAIQNSGSASGIAGRPSGSGALYVDGTKLKGQDGKEVVLNGISTHGLAWFPEYVNAGSFKQISNDWNMNAVRLAMYTEEYGGYCSGGNREQLKKLVRDGVKFAKDADMYAIVDWHILADGHPTKNKAEAIAFFDMMSSEFADCNHVIYEICNEPNNGADWNEIKGYAEEVISVIRKHDKDAVIIIGTPTWSQDVDVAAENPVKGKNLMYALHFYAGTHKQFLRDKAQKALNKGIPIIVSEYSICDASGNGNLDYAEAEKWVEFLDKNKISRMAWNLSNKAESSAVIGSWCSKKEGFAEQDLSEFGKWLIGKTKNR